MPTSSKIKNIVANSPDDKPLPHFSVAFSKPTNIFLQAHNTP